MGSEERNTAYIEAGTRAEGEEEGEELF